MTIWFVVTTAVVAVAAAVRSTWSPCGLSMLATVTPLAERSRGHRYAATATWFALGSLVGGLALGALGAAGAAAVRALGPTATTATTVAAVCCLLGAASDSGIGGFRLPVHHRQVNERWLDRFRPWVYGSGFGFQIGCGLATYIMTAAVYLVLLLGALTAVPWVAVALGGLFGLVRGMAVLAGRRIVTSEQLRAFHLRFYRRGPVVARLTTTAQLAAAAAFAWMTSTRLALVVAGGAVLVVGGRRVRRRMGRRRYSGRSRPSATVEVGSVEDAPEPVLAPTGASSSSVVPGAPSSGPEPSSVASPGPPSPVGASPSAPGS